MPYEKNYQINEAMNGVVHFANGRCEADGEEPYEDGEHASSRNASPELPERDGYLGESDGEIGEDDGNDLEGAAAQTSGAELHRSRDDVADAKRHVADVEARSDGECGVAGETDRRGADAEEKRTCEGGVVVTMRLAAPRGGSADRASGLSVDAIVFVGKRGATKAAALDLWR